MAGSSLYPGFRFHPTDVELVMYYLKRKLLGKKIVANAVAEVNIYDFGPWDLPDKSSLRNGDLEWFFFCPKSKKYLNGSRSNRATETGYWKATGKDRKVTFNGRTVATIKTLVFHLGHTGTGQRTDWVMHEYKMDDVQLADKGVVQDTFVLCKIFEKSGSGPKNGAQYGAPFYEEAWDDDLATCSGSQTVSGPNTVYPPTVNVTEPDLSAVTYLTNTLNTCNNKMKDPVVNVPLNEPGPSGLTCFPDENVTDTPNNCDNKLKTRLSEAGSSSLTFSPNEACAGALPLNDDMMLFEDLVSFLGLSPEDLLDGNNENESLKVAKSVAPKEDEGIFDELVNFINLDELDGENAAAATAAADINSDLRMFYVD